MYNKTKLALGEKYIMAKNRGFSLVEALIAAGILGGVAIFTMNIIGHYQMASKTKKAMAELNSFHQSILARIKDPKNCSDLFKEKSFGEELLVPSEYNVKDSKIQLTKIKIWHPTELKGYPITAPYMPNTPTQNGWLITVSFTYEVYKPKDPKTPPYINGPTEMIRYSQFVFNNFKGPKLVSDPSECEDPIQLINGTQEYNLEKEVNGKVVYSLKTYSLCWDTDIKQEIVSCFHY